MNAEHSCSYKFTFETLSPTALGHAFTPLSIRPVPLCSLAFNFKCETKASDWISHEYSTELVMHHSHPSRVRDRSFHLNVLKKDSESLQKGIKRELHHWWPFPEPYRYLMVKKAVRETMQWLKSSKPGDNNFLVNVTVNHLFNRVFELEVIPKMVCATDEAIESLERKKGVVNGSCSVCLEEFSEDCSVATMPCSHVFHGECIERWLKSSCYCPLCRYEMPSIEVYDVDVNLDWELDLDM